MVFPNFGTKALISLTTSNVSIPFKRDGLSERDYQVDSMLDGAGFNSLQTGWSFRTHILIKTELRGTQGFNSLQTGWSFRTRNHHRHNRSAVKSFNSLQTGWSFRTRTAINRGLQLTVSIPFKRDGLSELLFPSGMLLIISIKFQFPSNGMVFPNRSYIENICGPDTYGFNSLQTGWSFRTVCVLKWQEHKRTPRFQFPSNGMVFPNGGDTYVDYDRRGASFNSLQTGWSFRTHLRVFLLKEVIKFQFPSNGMVFPNGVCAVNKRRWQYGFNSLQTGWSFRTRIHSSAHRLRRKCFNSLQTGWSFRTHLKLPTTTKG